MKLKLFIILYDDKERLKSNLTNNSFVSFSYNILIRLNILQVTIVVNRVVESILHFRRYY